jgi:DNA mismatch repair protein MutL
MTMSKVHVLSEDVIGKISAGEVVERPASVVKELVENSIDAGADSVEIEVQGAGQALMRVADNGEGMDPEDAKTACQRHATSKISGIEDLERIGTLGFRGEALASIAAVSHMDLMSCSRSGAGVHLYLESGEILKTRPAGRARGTTVEVRNLFYNVPARRKFLKKDSTELAEIVNVVGRFMIAYPDMEFRLTHENRCLLHATRGMDIAERIRLVLGGDFADHMVDISGQDGECRISGYVSRPSSTRKDRRGQVFYVNGRFVRSRALNEAVYVAYSSMLERGRYPSAALFLTVEPSTIDVNVHPTKLEVKFDDEKHLKDLVRRAIRKRFDELRRDEPDRAAPDVYAPERPDFAGFPDAQTEFSYEVKSGDGLPARAQTTWDELAGADLSAGAVRRGIGGATEKDIFQVGDCYIVQIEDEGIVITDQHAAHERVLYEVFARSSAQRPVEKQSLLFPVRIDLAASESLIMSKLTDDFNELGFEIEPFGDRSFIVQAAPAILRDRDMRTVITDVLGDLSSCDLARIDRKEELVKTTSCRAAIKAGDKLTADEMRALLEQLKNCGLPFTCPHGRPTMARITRGELEKMFRRK